MPPVPEFPSEDVLELEYLKDDSPPPLISESDGEDEAFITPVPAAKPGQLSKGLEDGGDAHPSSCGSVQHVQACGSLHGYPLAHPGGGAHALSL